jgi:hypothetical protein
MLRVREGRDTALRSVVGMLDVLGGAVRLGGERSFAVPFTKGGNPQKVGFAKLGHFPTAATRVECSQQPVRYLFRHLVKAR